MTPLRIGIAVIWVAALLAGRIMGQATAASGIPATSAEVTAQPADRAASVLIEPSVEADDPLDPRVDLFGNEVEDALADYRIDHGGDVYEQHSPETALQKLGSPST